MTCVPSNPSSLNSQHLSINNTLFSFFFLTSIFLPSLSTLLIFFLSFYFVTKQKKQRRICKAQEGQRHNDLIHMEFLALSILSFIGSSCYNAKAIDKRLKPLEIYYLLSLILALFHSHYHKSILFSFFLFFVDIYLLFF